MSEVRVLRAGTWGEVTPDSADWHYLSFGVRRLQVGETFQIQARDEEIAAVVLTGAGEAAVDGRLLDITGRTSVFEGPPWTIYLPAGGEASYRALEVSELALVGARSDRPGLAKVIEPDDAHVEIRGAGSATRQINHILPPEFPAHRLLVVEVLTPSGNWSSYPPHKHDQDRPPSEVSLEEFYYFRISPAGGFAFQRVYSPERDVDVTSAVRDGDVVLVPFGYHVSGAPHGFDLYYLNGLAGDARSMAAADDPSLGWIRDTWQHMETDPRVPRPLGRRP